jgi:photosystem II stability/assembly factor-like uncharacterized protein
MRLFYSFCILVYTAATVSAQMAVVDVLTPFDFATNFQDVFVDHSGNGWAVGTCGSLASTQNNGQDWDVGTSPEGLDFNAVACKPGTDCQTVFLGRGGQVFRSTNGGQSWTEIPVSCDDPRGFNFVDDEVIVLSHSNESLFRSADSGDTWTEIPLEYTHRGEIHFPSATAGYIFQQSGGPLLKSTDAGATWDSIYQFDANAYFGDWVDENIGYLYDQNRHIFKTTDGGNNWTLVADTGVPSNLRHLVALSETELVAYVFPSSIFRSTDGGLTWVNSTAIGTGQFGLRFEGIHNNGSDFWIASWGTEILYSTDGLQTAMSQFPGLRPSFEAIAFPSNEIGYALQERIGMFKTTDGGDTWTQITNNFGTVSRDFLVLDEETVIIPYNSSGPQITENGGQSWAPLFPEAIQDTTSVFHIEQLPGGRLYLFGSVHGAYSDDGGDTWNVIYHDFRTFPRSMVFIDDQIGVVGSDGGKILATTDGGASWELVVDGDFTNQPLSSLFVLDNGTIVNTSSGITRCSSDGGQTWSTDACAGLSAPGAIIQGPDGSWYSARLFPSQEDLLTNIQRSTDEGQSWESIAGFCAYAIPGTVTPDGRYLYVYQSAGFLGRVDLENIVGTDETPHSAIKQAKVYPNPTSGLLRVDLPQNAKTAQVVLYDLHGRQVLQQTGNTLNLTLDLSALPNGMYLLKVQGHGWLQSARVIVIEE